MMGRPPVAGGADQVISASRLIIAVVGADIWLGATAAYVTRTGE